MLQECLNILNEMNQEDINVQTLKTLISATLQKNRVFYLEYEGKKLCYKILNHDAEFSNGSTFYLSTDLTDPIWCTPDLITAIYAKYVNTGWYNSTLETPTRTEHIDTDKIKVVDNYGNVYNRKLLNNRTIAILQSKIKHDDWLTAYIKDKEWCNKPWENLYDQQHLLEHMKKLYDLKKGTYKTKALSLSECYYVRKELIKQKSDRIKLNKSYNHIQSQLNTINKRIVRLGGR